MKLANEGVCNKNIKHYAWEAGDTKFNKNQKGNGSRQRKEEAKNNEDNYQFIFKFNFLLNFYFQFTTGC